MSDVCMTAPVCPWAWLQIVRKEPLLFVSCCAYNRYILVLCFAIM